MEAIAFAIITAGIGYIISMIQEMDKRMDAMMIKILKLEFHLNKRKEDPPN
jgi:hypothetical protein